MTLYSAEISSDLAGSHEVCSTFSISRETLRRWRRVPGFPAPVAVLNDGRTAIFSIDEIKRWRGATGR